MAKGSVIEFPTSEFTDPVTGARVQRLGPPDRPRFRNYFYQKSFSADGRFLVLGMETAGITDLWLWDRTEGTARQLTQGGGVGVQGCYLSPDGRWLGYHRGRQEHVRLDLETLEETVVYRVPDGWEGYGTWEISTDGTRLAAIEMWAADRVAGGPAWERFAAQFHRKPRQRLLDIEVATGRARVVLDDRRYIGHPQFRPGQNDLMGFCHEGPHDLVATRMWFVNADGSDLRPAKVQGPGEACTHEFWLPDGSRLVYVSYRKGKHEREIWAADPDTMVNQKLMDMPPCSHLMADRTGSLLVGDGAGPPQDVSDTRGHLDEPDPLLYLFDLETRTHRAVGVHGSSSAVWKGNTQANHPHPSFTPDGRQVLFASDREGLPGLYLVDLADAEGRMHGAFL